MSFTVMIISTVALDDACARTRMEFSKLNTKCFHYTFLLYEPSRCEACAWFLRTFACGIEAVALSTYSSSAIVTRHI